MKTDTITARHIERITRAENTAIVYGPGKGFGAGPLWDPAKGEDTMTLVFDHATVMTVLAEVDPSIQDERARLTAAADVLRKRFIDDLVLLDD